MEDTSSNPDSRDQRWSKTIGLLGNFLLVFFTCAAISPSELDPAYINVQAFGSKAIPGS